MEKHCYTVYMHKTPSGKVYIGLTKNKPERRWGKGNGYKNNPYFTKAIKKYGWDNIEHMIILSGLTQSMASTWESVLIAQYDSTNPTKGYNLTTGGQFGFNHTERTKLRIAEVNKKYWDDPEWSKTQKQKMKDAVQSSEVREKISSSVKELFKNPDYRELYIQGREKFKEKVRGTNNWKHRAVLQYSLDGNFIKKYETVAEAGLSLNKPTQDISKCLVGKYKHTYGYIWIYADEPNPLELVREKMAPSKTKKKIKQYTIEGEYIQTYDSIVEAKQALGKKRIRIVECAKGIYETAGGYVWKFA